MDGQVQPGGARGGGDERAAVCTESNQHIVTGALDMLEQLRNECNGRMLRHCPTLCNVFFLLSFATLRYDPMVRNTALFIDVPCLSTSQSAGGVHACMYVCMLRFVWFDSNIAT